LSLKNAVPVVTEAPHEKEASWATAQRPLLLDNVKGPSPVVVLVLYVAGVPAVLYQEPSLMMNPLWAPVLW